MERKQLRIFVEKYKRPLKCLRFVLIYQMFFLIAKYSSVFNTGIIPKDLWSTGIAVMVVMYRFLSIFVVPVILVLWILEFVENKIIKL